MRKKEATGAIIGTDVQKLPKTFEPNWLNGGAIIKAQIRNFGKATPLIT